MTKDSQLESAITSAVTAAANAAVVQTDISYIKKDVAEIKAALRDMSGTFVVRGEHEDVLKNISDHESRLRTIEENMFKYLGIAAVVSAILTIAIGAVINYFL